MIRIGTTLELVSVETDIVWTSWALYICNTLRGQIKG